MALETFISDKILYKKSHKKASFLVNTYITNDRTKQEVIFAIISIYTSRFMNNNLFPLYEIYKVCQDSHMSLEKAKRKIYIILSMLISLEEQNIFTIFNELPVIDVQIRQKIIDLSLHHELHVYAAHLDSYKSILNGNIFNLLCALYEIIFYPHYESTMIQIITYILSLKKNDIYFDVIAQNNCHIIAILFNILIDSQNGLSEEMKQFAKCARKLFEYMNPNVFEKPLKANKNYKSIRLVYITYIVTLNRHICNEQIESYMGASLSDFLFTYHHFDDTLINQLNREKYMAVRYLENTARSMNINDSFCNKFEQVTSKYNVIKS